MKNKTLKYSLILSSLLLVGGACENKLEQVNPNAQTSATFWQSQDDAFKGLNAAYLSLAVDGGYMRSTNLLLDTRGDDLKSNSPWDQMYNSGKFALNAGNDAIYGWAYGSYYEGISKANQVIDYTPKITMDAELKKRVLGQAYFLRGLYFFHLVNLFGNVSLPTRSVQTKEDFFVGQSTTEQGWNQVIEDFKKAAEMLPATYESVSGADKGQTGRATKGAALAYLGKTYLFNKKFAEAATQFKAVIDLGIYKLVPNYRDNFTEANENNSESLFEVQFSRDAGGKDMNWGGEPAPGWGRVTGRAITYGARGLGWTDVQPTRWILEEYQKEKTVDGKADPRLAASIFYNAPGIMVYGVEFSKRYGGNPQDLNDLFVRKYANDDTKADEFDWRSGINERLMRYADVLLMYAECLNEAGQTSQAIPFVQQVRSRAGLADLAKVKPNMTQAEFREQLAHERALELCLEGHRFDDLNRWGWVKDATKLTQLKKNDPEFETFKTGREYFPIPQREIDNNPGVKQNPSY
jgi:starch-binding outer membrane protein, SusD/RagB family